MSVILRAGAHNVYVKVLQRNASFYTKKISFEIIKKFGLKIFKNGF